MISATLLLFPIVMTGSLFLILYNNLYYGRSILLALLLLNVGFLFISGKRRLLGPALPWARFSSSCLIGVLGAILALEGLFPLVLPRDYNQILDLSKGFMGNGESFAPAGSMVFDNSDQHVRYSGNATRPDSSPVMLWHSPGHPFTYYGYDPNSGAHYINKFHWNSQGYFDHDYAYNRPEGVHRIVVIGDSYVEAAQVPLTRSFHKLVEADLNNNATVSGIRPQIEVIALGSSGSGQVEHFKVLRERAIRYKPDIVAVALCSNDFCDDDPVLKEELVLAAGGITPYVRRLASHGYFALAFAVRRIEDIRRNRIGVSPELLQWADWNSPRVEAAWARTLGTIRSSRDFCQARGMTFLLIYLGSDLEVKYALDPADTIDRLKAMGGPHEQMRWDMSRSLRRVTLFCEENDIVLISLLEPLIQAEKDTGKLVFGDHYTMFGHQVAAQVLSRAIDFRLQTHLAGRPTLKHSVSPETGAPLQTVGGPENAGESATVNYLPAAAGQVPGK